MHAQRVYAPSIAASPWLGDNMVDKGGPNKKSTIYEPYATGVVKRA